MSDSKARPSERERQTQYEPKQSGAVTQRGERPAWARTSRGRTRRGQSELVGFALIFSAAIVIIALAALTGSIGIENAQEFQQTSNAEQAFIALSNDVGDVTHHGVPSRMTEVGLADAQLDVAGPEQFNVTAGDESVMETSPVVYDTDSGTIISYHAGALIRQDGGSSVMFDEPDFGLNDGTMILSVVTTTADGVESVGGRTDVGVLAEHNETTVHASGETVDTVTIELTTAHEDAWTRYFESLESDDQVDSVAVTESSDEISATINLSGPVAVYVIETNVEVSFR